MQYVKQKKAREVLKRNNFYIKRNGKGDHIIWTNGIATFPLPSGEINRMMWQRICKENNLL